MEINNNIVIGKLKKQKNWYYSIDSETGIPLCGYTYNGIAYGGNKISSIHVSHYLLRDQVRFSNIKRGQSSTRAILESRRGGVYELSPTEIGFYIQVLTGLTNTPFTIDSDGYVDIHFVLCKQGSNIGIELVDPETIKYDVL